MEPGPRQESVWDYPCPPAMEDSLRHVEVRFNGVTIADSDTPTSFSTCRLCLRATPPSLCCRNFRAKLQLLEP